jgi:O-antigen ligase
LISTALQRVESSTAYSRWHIFEKALESIGRNPLVGAGYDQISTSGIQIDSRPLGGTIHNMFLQNWYVGGFFAFLGWLLLYIHLGWLSISTGLLRARKDVTPILLGIASATISIILMDQFQDFVYQREKWLILGLLAGLCWDAGGEVPVVLPQKVAVNATTGD